MVHSIEVLIQSSHEDQDFLFWTLPKTLSQWKYVKKNFVGSQDELCRALLCTNLFGKVEFYYLSKEKREQCTSLRNVLAAFFSGYNFWYFKNRHPSTQEKGYELAAQNGEKILYLLEARRPRPCSVNCRSWREGMSENKPSKPTDFSS